MNSLLLARRGVRLLKRKPLVRTYATTSEPKLFDKILIANRGEIACRIMRTCKNLGIKTVAVHSDADVFAKHVQFADEAVNIGPPPSKDSYLRVDRIMEAIKKTGAQAVHPGYGFLSEKEHFVHELEKNNVVFIGPPSTAIHAMGDKVESKKLAKSAGVNIIPGHLGVVDTVEEAIKMANQIGYPVMVKASGGGGGKGMRIAWNDTEVREGYRLSKQEALSSFGDDRLLIERFIDNPRHIEIQVLCDKHGNRLYLNERECSIQRRNQKVIEEAPSSFLTPEVRHAMGEQAVALCKRVGYVSAGTCEFLVDPQRNFYFLEMNTRLQVEHPVTEMTTGIDLVEWMIKVAAGWRLPFQQQEIPLRGWAMETRVYAEDPLRGFLPSIGRLVRYKEPGKTKDSFSDEAMMQEREEQDPEAGNPNIRVDSGVYEGSEISIYYDPLISKLITYGENRQEAINHMVNALDTYLIRGVNHNVNFLRDTFTHPRFLSGDISTKFIPQEFPDGYHGHKLTDNESDQLLCITAALHHLRVIRDAKIGGAENPNGAYIITLNGKDFQIGVNTTEDKVFSVSLSQDEEPTLVDLSEYPIDDYIISVKVGNEPITAQLFKLRDLGYDIQFSGSVYSLDVYSLIEAELKGFMKDHSHANLANNISSPMAGTLISIAVKPGDRVVVGQEIAVVEAMKMQNMLRATRDGIVKQVKIEPGKPVQLDEVIVELDNLKPEQEKEKK